MNLIKTLLIGAGIAAASVAAQAGVVGSGAVDGLATFTDTSTGRVWLRLDNFFDATTGTSTTTTAQDVAAAQAAGFTWAQLTDVQQLLLSLPLDGGQFSSYGAVIGEGIPRQLIWGAYDNGSSEDGWGYAYSPDTNWTFDSGSGFDLVAAGNPAAAQDLGVWAFRTSAVPEPAAWLMLGIGALASFGAARRRRA